MTELLHSICYGFDALIYTGMCRLLEYLPETIYKYLLPLFFSVNTMGAREKGNCVYLVNYNEPMSNVLAFGMNENYVTDSAEDAIEMAERMGIPIQTVVCYYSKEYFCDGWVYPQPYELVYEYGEVGTKTTKEYNEYFFERLKARPGVRLFEKNDDHYRLLFVALLCSRFPLPLVYLLLRYQWYNRYCFHMILAIAALLSLLA